VDTTQTPELDGADSGTHSQEARLRELRSLFGDFKAEWLREKVYELFAEPSYFPMLEGRRPCVLTGGRGTGKTSALKSMSYRGQFFFRGNEPGSFPGLPQIGLYYRINSNRVAIFRGPELDDAGWMRLFAHYINLIFCTLLVEFVEWYVDRINPEYAIDSATVESTARAFGASGATVNTSSELKVLIASLTAEFELAANNVADRDMGVLSAPGAPVDILAKGLLDSGEFGEVAFAFLLDEYENLDVPQQRVLNTLLKHAGDAYTFKIGAKQGGLRTRETTAPGQEIQDPADFALVDITSQLLESGAFSEFAQQVCDGRLSQIVVPGGRNISDVTRLFPSLTAEEEAELQGVSEEVAALRAELETELLAVGDAEVGERELSLLSSMHDYELYVMWRLGGSSGSTCLVALRDAAAEIGRWKTQYSNYRQAYLFALRSGKVGIRKYYSGWQTVVQLAAGNIRLLMELVEACFARSAVANQAFGSAFDPDLQTQAFIGVGQKNLMELNANREGATLSKLLLGLGRVFGVLAGDPDGHTPEVTEFNVSEESQLQQSMAGQTTWRELVEVAVMELVLIRQPGTKLTSYEVRDYEYRVHPAYSPFFVMPAGKKRRITLSADEIVQLASEPKRGVSLILRRLHRTEDENLPPQLFSYAEVLGDEDR